MPLVRNALRAVKNTTRTDAEALTRSVTRNDALPPSGKQMHDLAMLSYNACVVLYAALFSVKT
jgi:hypothetical protein